MKIYQLYRKQILPIPLQEAWDYFSTPNNLNELTPPEMKFQILGSDTLPPERQNERTFPGQIIRYRITPFAGIPMSWTTEITKCEVGKYFIDEQRFGPYKLWHHQHHFQETSDGVLMEDILHYGLPMGWIGRLIAGRFVQNKVEHIFDYRYKMLEQRFNTDKIVFS